MFEQQHIKTAEKIVQDFFQKMTFPVTVRVSPIEEEGVLFLEISSDDAQVLIGQQGKTLMEIQQLLGRIIKKQLETMAHLDMDINRYKANKTRYLAEMAHAAADEVVLVGLEKVLEPMNAFERRIVHAELSQRGDVATESMGEEPSRMVVIRPMPRSF